MISIATITLHVKHYKTDDGVEAIDIRQTLTGGIEGTQENRTLDWVERAHEDKVFGPCSSCCYYVTYPTDWFIRVFHSWQIPKAQGRRD